MKIKKLIVNYLQKISSPKNPWNWLTCLAIHLMSFLSNKDMKNEKRKYKRQKRNGWYQKLWAILRVCSEKKVASFIEDILRIFRILAQIFLTKIPWNRFISHFTSFQPGFKKNFSTLCTLNSKISCNIICVFFPWKYESIFFWSDSRS